MILSIICVFPPTHFKIGLGKQLIFLFDVSFVFVVFFDFAECH
jgi:hypothetical protein